MLFYVRSWYAHIHDDELYQTNPLNSVWVYTKIALSGDLK